MHRRPFPHGGPQQRVRPGSFVEVHAAYASSQVQRLVRSGASAAPASGIEDPSPAALNTPERLRSYVESYPLIHKLNAHFDTPACRCVVRWGMTDGNASTLHVALGFSAGCTPSLGVMVGVLSSCLSESMRRFWAQELRHIGSLRHQKFIAWLMYVDVEEPQQDILIWMNLLSAESQATLVLVWSWDEAIGVMEGLLDGSGAGGHPSTWSAMSAGATAAPIPILVAALTQTPSLMSRSDVVRAASSAGSVAEFLLWSESQLTALPGVGARKAKRIIGTLHAPFPTTQARLKDILLTDPPQGAGESVSVPPAIEAGAPHKTGLDVGGVHGHAVAPEMILVPCTGGTTGGACLRALQQPSAAFTSALQARLRHEDTDDESA